MKTWWKLAPATDEKNFPRGWHLMGKSADGPVVIGSVCGEYVATEPSYGDSMVSWRWRVPGGKTSALQYAEENDAKAALEQYLARRA